MTGSALDEIAGRFRRVAPAASFWSIRIVEDRTEELAVVRDVAEPPRTRIDLGAMITVVDAGGAGYAATSDLGDAGLERAARRALEWAGRTAGSLLVDPSAIDRNRNGGEYETATTEPWTSTPLADRIDLLRGECRRLKADDRIVDWSAALWCSAVEMLLVTSDGLRVRQRFHQVLPTLAATAHAAGDSETRSFGGHAWCRQGGLEVLGLVGFLDAAPRIAEEALELLAAPNCPSGRRDLLLAPDQMILQIHESIGHPLELDRILGDERNYAGRSFVTPDLFGRYRYGSKLLDVTFDPTVAGEFASYAFDDEGTPARREYLIHEGILLRPLGGAVSQARAGLPGVACARSRGWNRPPIDRMANLNLEPGDTSFAEMVRGVERGISMETNCSWSIDDSRNKFQFGCERGRIIRDGELREVVRKPCYRGVTTPFWRSLDRVGNRDTFRVMGTPYCGKGEPNQEIRAGHAAPACLFREVEVFGGER